MKKKSKIHIKFPSLKKKKEEAEVIAVIKEMKCKSKEEGVLICDITAKSGDKQIKDKIAIRTPKLKFIEIKKEGKKPEYYFKEIDIGES